MRIGDWTPLDYAILRELYFTNGLPELQQQIGKSKKAITAQAARLGLYLRSRCRTCGIDLGIPVTAENPSHRIKDRYCPSCILAERLRQITRRKTNGEKATQEWIREHGKEADLLRLNEWVSKHSKTARDKAREHFTEQKLTVLMHYSPNLWCVRCGFSDIRALQLDHINGGGTRENRASRRHSDHWTKIIKAGFPKGYQVLCANCNWVKKYENGEVGRPGTYQLRKVPA